VWIDVASRKYVERCRNEVPRRYSRGLVQRFLPMVRTYNNFTKNVEVAGSSETLIDSILAQQTVVCTLAVDACGHVYACTVYSRGALILETRFMLVAVSLVLIIDYW
jgi:hypothetical protein